jgi:hypothetical protein
MTWMCDADRLEDPSYGYNPHAEWDSQIRTKEQLTKEQLEEIRINKKSCLLIEFMLEKAKEIDGEVSCMSADVQEKLKGNTSILVEYKWLQNPRESSNNLTLYLFPTIHAKLLFLPSYKTKDFGVETNKKRFGKCSSKTLKTIQEALSWNGDLEEEELWG